MVESEQGHFGKERLLVPTGKVEHVEKELLHSWWSIMVPWALSWPWPVVRMGGKRCMSVGEAVGSRQVVSSIFHGGLLESSSLVNSDFGNVGE